MSKFCANYALKYWTHQTFQCNFYGFHWSGNQLLVNSKDLCWGSHHSFKTTYNWCILFSPLTCLSPKVNNDFTAMKFKRSALKEYHSVKNYFAARYHQSHLAWVKSHFTWIKTIDPNYLFHLAWWKLSKCWAKWL